MLVYDKIGGEKIPTQFTRILLQIILVFWIIGNKSKVALFLLTAFHIFSGFYILYFNQSFDALSLFLMIFHLTVGFIIYFHEWIEQKIGIKKS